MAGIDVRVTETSICLRAPSELVDDCRSIPGGKWHKPWSCWIYPKSPTAAARILDTFGQDADHGGRLAGMVQVIAQAREVKSSDPTDIPVTKTKPWAHQKKAFWFAVNLLGGLPRD